MILTLEEILKEVKFTEPLDSLQTQPCAIDIRVDSTIKLMAGRHMRATSMEEIELPDNIMAVVYPRSSLNRANVTLDMTGIVDPGYKGKLTLPLTAHTDVEIMKGQRIASLVFHRLEKPVIPKESKYHDSDGQLKPDKEEETELLQKGDIAGLKERFKI